MLSPSWTASAGYDRDLGRSPTFVVGASKQKSILEELKRRDQHISEQLIENKPLCFNSASFQRTHPKKAELGHSDADAALTSMAMLGVADGVSQVEELGIDASELPNELLKACESLAMSKLSPDVQTKPKDGYYGPISMVCEAYESTESFGATTLLLAVLDNSTKVHGKLHPMIAMISIGDCELVILRRTKGYMRPLEAIFHTEMQRIDGNVQAPLQICRFDDEVDPAFDESMILDVIQDGSAVHCVSAYEGDLLVLGTDGVFDNLYLDDVVNICNEMIAPSAEKGAPTSLDDGLLRDIAERIVDLAHQKTHPDASGNFASAPIGLGGKVDDTCCVVGEVVEWTEAHADAWKECARKRRWDQIVTCGGACRSDRGYEEPFQLESEQSEEIGEESICSIS